MIKVMVKNPLTDEDLEIDLEINTTIHDTPTALVMHVSGYGSAELKTYINTEPVIDPSTIVVE